MKHDDGCLMFTCGFLLNKEKRIMGKVRQFSAKLHIMWENEIYKSIFHIDIKQNTNDKSILLRTMQNPQTVAPKPKILENTL